jgi:hypothetical protein
MSVFAGRQPCEAIECCEQTTLHKHGEPDRRVHVCFDSRITMPYASRLQKCTICSKKGGACVQCASTFCKLTFHPVCCCLCVRATSVFTPVVLLCATQRCALKSQPPYLLDFTNVRACVLPCLLPCLSLVVLLWCHPVIGACLRFGPIRLNFTTSVTQACARRPGAAASVSRRRRERRTLHACGCARPLSAYIRFSPMGPKLRCTAVSERARESLPGSRKHVVSATLALHFACRWQQVSLPQLHACGKPDNRVFAYALSCRVTT